MLHTVTFAVVFDTKKTKNPELGILKIRVTHRRINRIYSTGIKVSSDTWQRLKKTGAVLEGRIKDEEFIKLHHSIYGYTKKGQRLDGWMDRYQKVADDLGPNFSFDALKKGIENYGVKPVAPPVTSCALAALSLKSADMHKRDRPGNGDIYASVAASFTRFVQSLTSRQRMAFGIDTPKKDEPFVLPFRCITPDFLEQYERWMQVAGKASQKPGNPPGPASSTTTGIYTRHLRSVFNDAIRARLIDADAYPFGRGSYIVPSGRNPKKALKREDIERIKIYVPDGDSEQRAHDLYLFTYYGNGINAADICRLRWKDIDQEENTFSFYRKKTQLTTKGDSRKITVYLREETWAVIGRWGTPKIPNNYIFPFLDDNMTAARQKAIIAQVVHQTNKWMKRIGEKLGITDSLVTYSARHSFGTTLLRSGVPLKHISDSFGHGSITTTEKYFAAFENEDIKEFMKAL